MIEQIVYIAGVVLNDALLLPLVDPDMPNVYCHHVTIKYGGIDKLPGFVGDEITFVGERLVSDDCGVALAGYLSDAGVNSYMPKDQIPHITICTSEGVPPVYSNNLIRNSDGVGVKIRIKLRLGAFVRFNDRSTGWIFNKKES